jgi:hypothetical protein
MRAASAVVLLCAPLLLASALQGAIPSDPEETGLTEEMNPNSLFAPTLIPSLVLPVLFAFAVRGRKCLDVHGMGIAARVAAGLGILGLLIPMAWGFGSVAQGSDSLADFPPPLSLCYAYLFLGIAFGALLFEPLRSRAARRSGETPVPAVGDGMLLFAAALGFLGMFLVFVKF